MGASSISIPPGSPGQSQSSRRSFRIFGGSRFSFQTSNIVDTIFSACTVFVETIVLILGPFLICFASAIISGLTWVFFTIYLPMLRFDLDHREASPVQRFLEIGANVGFVGFLLVEIIFNYYMCVRTKNTGPSSSYDKVVRELAESTGFQYPNSPQELARFRRAFDDKMMIRMRRRQARDSADRQRKSAHSRCCDENGKCSSVTPSGTSSENDSSDVAILGNNGATEENGLASESVTMRKTSRQQQQSRTKRGGSASTPNTQVRSWMLMAPDEWGYCTKTNQPKPPRSHYDHVSKSLVLCFDHYCPWMFNAIGYFNYRYFVNFLLYVYIAMMYGVLITYRPFTNSTGVLYREQLSHYRRTGVWMYIHPYTPTSDERMPLSLGFMLCLAVGFAVACLGGFHVYLLLTGQTTIEFHGNVLHRAKAKRLGKKYRNPYDMGWKRNWEQVYGQYGATSLSMLMAFLIPSRREPDFLPLPIGGEDGKRKHLRCEQGEEELHPFLDSNV